jgi:hypothetical protein
MFQVRNNWSRRRPARAEGKWYLEPRLVAVNDLYAFEPGVHPQYEQFTDIVGRHFRLPKRVRHTGSGRGTTVRTGRGPA